MTTFQTGKARALRLAMFRSVNATTQHPSPMKDPKTGAPWGREDAAIQPQLIRYEPPKPTMPPVDPFGLEVAGERLPAVGLMQGEIAFVALNNLALDPSATVTLVTTEAGVGFSRSASDASVATLAFQPDGGDNIVGIRAAAAPTGPEGKVFRVDAKVGALVVASLACRVFERYEIRIRPVTVVARTKRKAGRTPAFPDLKAALKTINALWRPAGIAFEYAKTDASGDPKVVDTDVVDTFDFGDDRQSKNTQDVLANPDEGAVNLYLVDRHVARGTWTGAFAWTASLAPEANSELDTHAKGHGIIAFLNDVKGQPVWTAYTSIGVVFGHVIAHEIGHYFNLLHTVPMPTVKDGPTIPPDFATLSSLMSNWTPHGPLIRPDATSAIQHSGTFTGAVTARRVAQRLNRK